MTRPRIKKIIKNYSVSILLIPTQNPKLPTHKIKKCSYGVLEKIKGQDPR